jgi:hypothetical protein
MDARGIGGADFKMKAFSAHLKANFRKSFWEIAIFMWAAFAIVLIGSAIAIGGVGLNVGLILFGIGAIGAGLGGALTAAMLAPMLVFIRWVRDRHEAGLDSLDSN